MSVTAPGFTIPRRSVVGVENEWVKMFDPPNETPATPELLAPTNPVPEVMASAGLKTVSIPHTLDISLLSGLDIITWDNNKTLQFFTIRDHDLIFPFNRGKYPAATIRVPRGVIFHGGVHGEGPPPHTIHWHGIEPTPINDGVGHCSMEIGEYTYQWQPNFIGTYFYHCHRNTVQHFEFGLFGLLLIEPPDTYFATQQNPAIPIGACRDGKRRTAANVANFPKFPGFNSNPLDAPDPSGQFPTDPHAMTVPYDAEAFWVFDDRDSRWSDMAPGAFATFPVHGDQPGVNDLFHQNPGVDGFFAFNDYHPDYFFVTGVPVPSPAGGIGTIDPAGAPPRGGGLPGGLIPPALNSGVSGTQVSINAQVGRTILVRCLDAAYAKTRVTFPVDVVIIAWDGRALGVPPFTQYNHAFLLPANTPITISTARRFDALIRETSPINSFATVEFINTRGDDLVMTARIPIEIGGVGGFTISGRVTSSDRTPLAGVAVTLTGAANNTVVTDSVGNYSLTGLDNGSYTVTPSLAGSRFEPLRRNVIINSADVIGRDFRAT